MIHTGCLLLLAEQCTLGRALSATSRQQLDVGENVCVHVMLPMLCTRMRFDIAT